ncbi:MAG: phospholipase D-like domain-containing protein [Kiritimatiellae bacterium]|nr:phospholipase D-like domain-containing protein [Kiritimatiellia bacterium]MDW8459463.1 phospholipase D-like domain-containing protein [Verrucomicrobiota bacterium]
MADWWIGAWPHLAAAAILALDVWAAAHAILYKRDPRSATTWIGVILLFPVAGAALYVLLGINRIQRRAVLLRDRRAVLLPMPGAPSTASSAPLPDRFDHLLALSKAVGRISDLPLCTGNAITPLRNGEEAYPAMLAAIESAQVSVTLSTYIFAHDAVGLRFADALGDAVERGVQVRVLIDDVGARYSFPTIYGALERRHVKFAAFMPTFFHWRMPYINLRNHRKILVVDSRVGFTGGMNIRQNHLVSDREGDRVQDLHFRIEGPAVAQMQTVFAEDWAFTTGERLEGDPWFAEPRAAGDIWARGIPDGPDEDRDKLRSTILAALACARRRVRIVTPYFLPDSALISSLNTCALRGVEVQIVIPLVNNLRAVGWACQAHLWQVLERGCRVWRTPPPFDHSKLFVVDDAWSLIGSGNWDPRSLRLNFEFNLECYHEGFAAELNRRIDEKIASAREATLAELDARPLPIRLRDGVARLFWPYL